MATRYSNTLIPTNTPAPTGIQAWAGFIDLLLTTTGGWVNTTDTGQTATGSLTVPGAANAKNGYRIYRMNDALQATNPVFIRIDFGSGNVAATPAIWLTVGTGSDGSGNITGTLMGSTQIAAGTNNTNASNSYGSADVNRFAFAVFTNASNVPNMPVVVTLERSKDTNGNDTSDGLQVIYSTSLISLAIENTQYLIWAGGTQPAVESGISYIMTAQNPTFTLSPGDVAAGVIIHFKGVAQQPGMNMVAVNTADVSSEGNFQMTLYGAVRTYQQVQQKFLRAGQPTNLDNNTRCCIRYD